MQLKDISVIVGFVVLGAGAVAGYAENLKQIGDNTDDIEELQTRERAASEAIIRYEVRQESVDDKLQTIIEKLEKYEARENAQN